MASESAHNVHWNRDSRLANMHSDRGEDATPYDLPISVEALYVASSLIVLSTCFVIQRASIGWRLCRYR